MRTTVELPDELMTRAKVSAAAAGVSLRQFFITAVERNLDPRAGRTRRPLPSVSGPPSGLAGVLTAEQIDEAIFG